MPCLGGISPEGCAKCLGGEWDFRPKDFCVHVCKNQKRECKWPYWPRALEKSIRCYWSVSTARHGNPRRRMVSPAPRALVWMEGVKVADSIEEFGERLFSAALGHGDRLSVSRGCRLQLAACEGERSQLQMLESRTLGSRCARAAVACSSPATQKRGSGRRGSGMERERYQCL